MSLRESRPAPTTARRVLGCAAAFVAMNVTGTVIAMLMGPFVGPHFGALIRHPERDGLNFPALLGGYLVIAAVLAFLHGRSTEKGAGASAVLGLSLGLAVFLGDHLVTAGWSVMPAGTMAIAGLFDSLAVAVGGVVFSWVTLVGGKGLRAPAN